MTITLNGSSGITTSTTGNSSIILDAGTGSASANQESYIDFKLDGTLKSTIKVTEATSGNPLEFHTGGAQRVVIDSSGNVGINESSPDTKLHISNNQSATPMATFENIQSHESTIRFKTAHSASSDYRVGASITVANAFEVYNVNAAATRMIINSSGNLGIGTSSPTQLLHLEDTGSVNGRVVSSDGLGDAGIKLRSGGSYDVNLLGGSDTFKIHTGGSEKMRIDSSGNVGIGTSSPTQKLEVTGNILAKNSGNPYIAVLSTGAGNNPFVRIQADTNYWDLQSLFSNADDELDFRYNGTSKMMITSAGNVGIGTTSPSNRLHVTNSSSTVATGYFNNTSTGGDSPALIVQGGANNNNAVGTFVVRDYDGNTDFHVGGTGDVGIGGVPSYTYRAEIQKDQSGSLLMLHRTGDAVMTQSLVQAFQITQSNSQSARLAEIIATGVNNWGGKMTFGTKPANGAPNNSTNDVMILDEAGRVRTPYQPSFRVGKSNTVSGNGTVITYDTVYHNIGSHYNTSNGRFTAPVAGVYYFGAQGISGSNSTSNEQNYRLRKNGSAINDARSLGYTQSSFHLKTIVELAIGDYVDIIIGNVNTSTYPQAFHNQFMGFLIG